MKFEMDKVSQGEILYIEAEDILAVHSYGRDGYAVRLSLRYRRQYQGEEYDIVPSALGSRTGVRLIARQVAEMISQMREAQKEFCSPCFDFGKLEKPPPHCFRCQLLEACRKGGGGDLRQARPQNTSTERPLALILALASCMLIAVLTFMYGLGQADRASYLEQQLNMLRRQKIEGVDRQARLHPKGLP